MRMVVGEPDLCGVILGAQLESRSGSPKQANKASLSVAGRFSEVDSTLVYTAVGFGHKLKWNGGYRGGRLSPPWCGKQRGSRSEDLKHKCDRHPLPLKQGGS